MAKTAASASGIKYKVAVDDELGRASSVTINGEDSGVWFGISASWHPNLPSVADLGEGAANFTDMMARSWNDALDYHKELEQLSPAMNELAASEDAGFLDKAMEDNPLMDEASLLAVSRELACIALVEWAAAVDAE